LCKIVTNNLFSAAPSDSEDDFKIKKKIEKFDLFDSSDDLQKKVSSPKKKSPRKSKASEDSSDSDSESEPLSKKKSEGSSSDSKAKSKSGKKQRDDEKGSDSDNNDDVPLKKVADKRKQAAKPKVLSFSLSLFNSFNAW